MKVVFAGPSLFGADVDTAGIVVRPPAVHGDVVRAVSDGASIIGLIDGNFQAVASVWHKEILFALSCGVRVLGAASMGALRAAECNNFGMEPIGQIATRYLNGELDDDAAVALLQGPAELGYLPLTEPLVDALATLDAMLVNGRLDRHQHRCLLASATNLFFQDRTDEAIVANADLPNPSGILADYREHHVSIKREDALELLDAVQRHIDVRRSTAPTFSLSTPVIWVRALERLSRERITLA